MNQSEFLAIKSNMLKLLEKLHVQGIIINYDYKFDGHLKTMPWQWGLNHNKVILSITAVQRLGN